MRSAASPAALANGGGGGDEEGAEAQTLLHTPAALRARVAALISQHGWPPGDLDTRVGLSLLQTVDWGPLRLLCYDAPAQSAAAADGSGGAGGKGAPAQRHAALLLGPSLPLAATLEGLNALCSCRGCAAKPPTLGPCSGSGHNSHGSSGSAAAPAAANKTCLHGALAWVRHVDPAGWAALRSAACAAAGVPATGNGGGGGGGALPSDVDAAEMLRAMVLRRLTVRDERAPPRPGAPATAD